MGQFHTLFRGIFYHFLRYKTLNTKGFNTYLKDSCIVLKLAKALSIFSIKEPKYLYCLLLH